MVPLYTHFQFSRTVGRQHTGGSFEPGNRDMNSLQEIQLLCSIYNFSIVFLIDIFKFQIINSNHHH